VICEAGDWLRATSRRLELPATARIAQRSRDILDAVDVGSPVPEALARASVLDAAGDGHALGEAWAAADAIVIFVRHFACAGCSDHLAELRPRLAELAALATGVVIVGSGTVEQLAAFVAVQQLAGHPIEVVTDPTLAAYRAAGLERSRLGTLGPRALANLGLLALRGHTSGRACGDLYQQGGTLYVRRGGELAFVHRSTRIGDHAPVAQVVALALAARADEAGVA